MLQSTCCRTSRAYPAHETHECQLQSLRPSRKKLHEFGNLEHTRLSVDLLYEFLPPGPLCPGLTLTASIPTDIVLLILQRLLTL